MPNRIIKESIKTSDDIDKLTWFEEVVFYRLIVTADDYGCLDGRTIVLRNELFPTKDNVSKDDVENAIEKLIEIGLVIKYESDGKPYLFLPKWESHQRVRNHQRKYPIPPANDTLLPSCGQSSASCGQSSENCPSESNPIQSESNIESESNPNPIYCRADEVIDHLNMRMGSQYKHSNSSRKHIVARLNEGFTVDDCKTVIDKKCVEWMGGDMEKYLRPETLFGNKFENYLNAKVTVPQKHKGGFQFSNL